MNHRSSAEILGEVLRLTKAEPVEATGEERELLGRLEEQRRRSERDSVLSREVRAKKRREEELLAQARGDLGAIA